MESSDIMENTEISEEIQQAENTELAAAEDVTGTEIQEPEEEQNNYPSQTVLTIRAIVGGYVMYLAYQIITSDSEKTPLIWAAVVFFIIAGAALIIMSIKHFICKEYK